MIRIQHKEDGQGVYTRSRNSSDFVWDILQQFSFGRKHPTASEDSELADELRGSGFSPDMLMGFRYGFENESQMREWFYCDSFFEAAHKEGFELVHVEGKIFYGETQCVVLADTMRIVKRESLERFFK